MSTVSTSQNLTFPSNPKPEVIRAGNLKQKLFYLIAGLFIIGLLLFLAKTFLLPDKLFNNPSAKVIVMVGKENIYQQDLDKELDSYPEKAGGEEKKDILLAKLIQDSVILQGAQHDGLITLDDEVFNSANKDYQKRITKVSLVTKTLNNQSTEVEGELISLWFNNNSPGEIGYEEGKKIAFDTMSQLRKLVVEKELTMKQAADKIMDNSSLGQVDPAYRTNAYAHFTAKKDSKITLDSKFDSQIRSTQEGQLTSLYLAKDLDAETLLPKEALYMFAQVTKKKYTDNPLDFDDWLVEKRKNYEVKYL